MKNCGCKVRVVEASDWRDMPSYRIDRKRCIFRDSPTLQVRVKKTPAKAKKSKYGDGTCPYGCNCLYPETTEV